jgi:hypothetical protein
MSGIVNGLVALDSSPVVTSSGDNNDVTIAGTLVYVIVSNDNDAITGVVNSDTAQGSLVFLVNVGSTNRLIVKHDDAGSVDENKILSYSGTDVTVNPYQTALLGYDTTNLRWHVINFA